MDRKIFIDYKIIMLKESEELRIKQLDWAVNAMNDNGGQWNKTINTDMCY